MKLVFQIGPTFWENLHNIVCQDDKTDRCLVHIQFLVIEGMHFFSLR